MNHFFRMGQSESIHQQDSNIPATGMSAGYAYTMPKSVYQQRESNASSPFTTRIQYAPGAYQNSGGSASSSGVFQRQSNPILGRSTSNSDAFHRQNNVPKFQQIQKVYNPGQCVNVDNMDQRIDKFEEEQLKFQEAIDRIKARREAAFLQELSDFENHFNPFEILGIDVTQDEHQVRRAYKRQSLKHHPDKGGDEKAFALVTKAYIYIMKKLDRYKVKVADQNELREQSREANQPNHQHTTENIFVNKNDFNKEKFNAVFNDFRISQPDDHGYGDWMEKTISHNENSSRSDTLPSVKSQPLFDGNFNRDVFNDVFSKDKTTGARQDIIIFEDPKPLISGNLDYYELGKKKTDNFGYTDRVNSNAFTDYKKAYNSDNVLIDADQVTFKKYKNVKDLEKTRDSLSYALSPEDRRKVELQKRRDELEEEERQLRMREHDHRVESNFQKINRALLTN